jgi:hypothetical protein
MVLEQNLSLVKKVNRLLNWGHWFTFFNILLALLISSSFWWSEPLPQTVLGSLYLLVNWLGHTAFLCFMFFILTIFPLSLIFPYQKHVRGLGATLATVGMVLLIFDAYVYNQLGYHLGSASFDQTLALLRAQVVTNLRNFVLIVTLVGALLLTLQIWLSNFCWKKISRLSASGIGQPALAVFFGSFMLSHLLHIYADASLNFDITRQDNVLPFSYPATAKSLLARYQLVDLTERAKRQADKLSLEHANRTSQLLSCQAGTTESTLLLVTASITAEQLALLQQHGLRSHDQHFAPNNAAEALLNLLYGQFKATADAVSALQMAPAWLNSVNASDVQVVNRTPALNSLLPWANTELTSARLNIVFDADFSRYWSEYQQFSRLIVVPLHSDNAKFQLAPVTAYLRWPALLNQARQHGSQQLDWLPTLLGSVGCETENRWLGDNLFQPETLPKLNISQQDIISVRKDKMMILRQDGSYGVWSAGTLVPLNDPLNVPMLVDALKRLEE